MVKVGDYGLSKYISETRRGGHTESVGTFHYMAPEVGRGEYGREIDIYALGVICLSCHGQLPFDGESSHEIIMKHLTATPDLSRLSEPYRNVIARALAKDPSCVGDLRRKWRKCLNRRYQPVHPHPRILITRVGGCNVGFGSRGCIGDEGEFINR